jgi:hypothetical protein
MIMNNEAIEEFGRRLVLYGRDEAIKLCDLNLRPGRESTIGNRWRAAAAMVGGEALVIPDYVDAPIFETLYEIDAQQNIHLLFTNANGETVDLLVDGVGELAGWYVGVPSWRSYYSTERILDADDIGISAIKAEYGIPDFPDAPAPNLDELEMPRRAIEELGILLVRHVRDVAIQSCDVQLLPHSETAMAKRWRKAAIPFNGKVPQEVLIPDCVDETLFTFLRAIDQGLLPLSFVTENGETVDLTKAGNLATRYIEPGGWRDQFSKERIPSP